jgi:EmrB/QacA subfamily drug resistance transporter
MTAARRLALAVLASGLLMTVLDGSIVTVAMPAIQRDVGFSAAGLSWVVNAYLIAFGSLLLLAGRLGDLLGRTRMFLTGTAVFTAASLLAGLAPNAATLVVARFLQGVGSAMVAGVSLAILVTLFTERRERAWAIAVYSFTGSAGASIGQVLGGVLTDALSWHWIFFINLPIGLAALAVAGRVLPGDPRRGAAGGADLAGAALVTAGLMSGIYAVVSIEQHGGTSPRTLGPAVLAVVLLGGFLARQATAPAPLMPPRVFRTRGVAAANAVQMLMVAALFAFQILVALYLQKVLGYGALRTGLAMLPAAVTIGVISLGLAARVTVRFGERRVLLAGLALLAAALGLLARVPTRADYLTDLLPVMLLAAGFGLALPALTTLGMSGARADDAGLASGLFNTTQQIGMAFGAAALSTLAASRTAALLDVGRAPAEALADGYRTAFAAGAGLLVAAFVTAALLLREPTRAAEPVAATRYATPESCATG